MNRCVLKQHVCGELFIKTIQEGTITRLYFNTCICVRRAVACKLEPITHMPVYQYDIIVLPLTYPLAGTGYLNNNLATTWTVTGHYNDLIRPTGRVSVQIDSVWSAVNVHLPCKRFFLALYQYHLGIPQKPNHKTHHQNAEQNESKESSMKR